MSPFTKDIVGGTAALCTYLLIVVAVLILRDYLNDKE